MKLVPLFLLSALMAGQASELTFNFSGVVQTVTPGVPPLISPSLAGTVFTASITYDDTFAPIDENPDPNQGRYTISLPPMGVKPLRYHISLADGTTLSDFSPVNSNVTIQNLPTGDLISIFGECDFSGGNGLLTFTFSDLTGRALTSDAWTTNYASPFWQTITVDFQSTLGDGSKFTGEANVPEPSATEFIFAAAVLGILSCRRLSARASRSQLANE